MGGLQVGCKLDPAAVVTIKPRRSWGGLVRARGVYGAIGTLCKPHSLTAEVGKRAAAPEKRLHGVGVQSCNPTWVRLMIRNRPVRPIPSLLLFARALADVGMAAGSIASSTFQTRISIAMTCQPRARDHLVASLFGGVFRVLLFFFKVVEILLLCTGSESGREREHVNEQL
jgi:hypothetical protein